MTKTEQQLKYSFQLLDASKKNSLNDFFFSILCDDTLQRQRQIFLFGKPKKFSSVLDKI